MGQLSEIESQKIYMNDYIKQYAIVKIVDGGAVYDQLCQDCTCTADIYDKDYILRYDDVSTVEISNGVFGHLTDPGRFQVDNTYYAMFNCSSPVYGSGLVETKVDIVSLEQGVSLGLTPSADSVDLPGEGIVEDQINNIFEIGQFIKSYTLDPVRNAELDGVSRIFIWLYDTTGSFLEFSKEVLEIFFFILTDPPKGIRMWLAMAWRIYSPLIYIFSAPLILYEMYIITFKMSDKNLTQAIGTIMTEHLKIFLFFKGIFDMAIHYTLMFFRLVKDIIGIFKPGGT